MNYSRIYNSLIERARARVPSGYVERHHIIPRCMGGSDNNTNLVSLYPEEHFLAHVLLVKMYPDERNLIIAVQKMCQPIQGYRRKRKLYGWLKRRHAKRMKELSSGSGNSQFGTRWIHNGTNARKIGVNESIPDGWLPGRRGDTKCEVCGLDTGAKRTRRFCDEHRPEPVQAVRWENGNSLMSCTMHITDGIVNRRIKLGSPIPDGFRKGRVWKRKPK